MHTKDKSASKQPPQSIQKTIVVGVIGNTLEWYDFLLYAYFAPIIAPLFFPSENPLTSLLATYGVFAIGFLARPLGALFIGRWGDLYGRKRALIISISLITIPTVMMGFLPTYASIGLWAPLLLLLIRCAQGFAVSGEITSAACYLIEHVHEKRRGFAGSLVMAGAYVGILLGAGIAALQTRLMPEDILHTWGWRIPFLLAGVFGIIALIIRLRSVESPHFADNKKAEQNAPFKTLITQHLKPLLKGAGAITMVATGNYFLIAYFNTYCVQIGKMHLSNAMLINIISIGIFTVLIPTFGYLSDRIGRRPVFLGGVMGMFILATPAFWLLSQHTVMFALLAEILFIIPLAAMNGPILTTTAELFPTEIRNTGASISYNTGQAIFGGTAPLVALTLIDITGNPLSPAWYLMGIGVISFTGIWLAKETYRHSLDKTHKILDSPYDSCTTPE